MRVLGGKTSDPHPKAGRSMVRSETLRRVRPFPMKHSGLHDIRNEVDSMLLFKPHHVPLILAGDKTQTRRKWPKGPRAKVGSIHECKTQLFGGRPFARVRVLKVYQERLGDMPEEDYRKEGLYTRESFRAVWTEI